MSDIVLEDDEQVTVLCNNLNVQGHDFLLDSAGRRNPQGPRLRRALVHADGDGLVVNFEGDYPGGVTLNGVADVHSLRPNLAIRGGLSYEAQGVTVDGRPATITVVIDEEFAKLQSQLVELAAKVAALEAHR